MKTYSEQEILDNTEIFPLEFLPELSIRILRLSGRWCEDDSGAFSCQTYPYWAFAWASGQAVARYLLDCPATVSGKRVVDFGAGCGLASVAASKSAAASVVASDIDPNAATLCRLNASLNNVTVDAVIADTATMDLTECDVLLAADVFFHWPENNSLLTSADAPPDVVVAMPHKRGFAPESGFPMDRLEKLSEYEVRTIPAIERPDIKLVSVYRLRR